MLKYMLDTNICVYVLKNYPPNLRGRFANLTSRLSISAITLGELCYGAEKSGRRSENMEEVEAFAERIVVLPFSAEAGRHSGQIRAELERAGARIGSQDLLIGAHARSEGLTLVTNNRREFDRVPALTVENWV